MRVVSINPYFPPDVAGGAEIVVDALVKQLTRRGVDMHVIALDTGTADGQAATVHRTPVRNIYAPGELRPAWKKAIWHGINSFDVRTARDVGRVLRELQPDLVHSHNLAGFSTRAWTAAARLGIPVVHTLHDYGLLCVKSTMTQGQHNCRSLCLACRVTSRIKRSSERHVRCVVGISRYVLECHQRAGWFRANQSLVIHNACLSATESRTIPPPQRLSRIGFLGRLSPEKGVELLLRELDEPFCAKHRLRLLIAGSGESNYVARCRSIGHQHVDWLGWQNSTSFVRSIDILVVPSVWNEPYGLVVAEAIANGTPVIVSRRGALAELVRDGQEGLVFDPDVSGTLQRCVERVANTPTLLQSLYNEAEQRASFFHIGRMLDDYMRVYESCASQPTTTPV